MIKKNTLPYYSFNALSYNFQFKVVLINERNALKKLLLPASISI